MKKSLVIAFILSALFLSSCAKIEETDAKEVVNQLVEAIEQGDYASASVLFCSDEDDGKTFTEFLEETETKTGLDFQAGIEIIEYIEYKSAPNSYLGVTCGSFDIKAIIDGKEIVLSIGVLENEGSIECYQFVIYGKNENYQFLCHYID